jgi:general secretion pathway protein A
MYTAFFDFKENPFNLTPDPKYLFLSSHHSEALDLLSYGITGRKGFVTITGNVGTGKTTLCRTLLDRLEDTTKTAVLLNPPDSALELLETINREFDIYEKTTSKRELLDVLYKYLLKNYVQGHNAVLIVDEAQNLSPAVLEQIRMLSNLETEKDKLIQIVLVGQPELKSLLFKPSLRQLKERITVWHHLKPLERKDVRDYIEFRLTVAGAPDNDVFLKTAIKSIFAYSRGNPRIINAICDRALLIAYSKDAYAVDKSTVLMAIDDVLGKSKVRWSRSQWWFQNSFAPAMALVLMLLVVLNVRGWNWQAKLSDLSSVAQKVAVLQGQALLKSPLDWEKARSVEKTASIGETALLPKSVKQPESLGAVTVDERASLSGLFRLFNVQEAQGAFGTDDVYPGLFSFEGDPQFYRLFTKPFRLRVKREGDRLPRYLLIREVTTSGAIAIDGKGNEVTVGDDVIRAHWNGEMSWIYPYEDVEGKLHQGMSGLGTLKVQQMLKQLGYTIAVKGIYDSNTSEEVARFQLNHGIQATGIVDTSTKALLYQLYG